MDRRGPPLSRSRAAGALALLAALLVSLFALAAGDPELKPDFPQSYTVRRGDTLWGIASRYLKDPWRWPDLWALNEPVENAHRIYPGDVLKIDFLHGRPRLQVERPPVVEERLLPAVRSEALEQPIPTLPPGVIGPFLSEPLAVSRRQLDRAGYVTLGQDRRVMMGDQDEFYARGLGRDAHEFYQLFRQGAPLRDPLSEEVLAYEAIYLGDARLVSPGDPAVLRLTRVTQEIEPKDRLLRAPKEAPLPYFTPRAPDRKVAGRIIHAQKALREFGPMTVVALNLGKKEGMEAGHVLRIHRRGGVHEDPVRGGSYRLPMHETGLLMVFRVFERVSYALILDASRPVNLYDVVLTP